MHPYKCAAQSLALNIAYFIAQKKPTIKEENGVTTVSRGTSYIKMVNAETGKYDIEVMFNNNDSIEVKGIESDYIDMYLDYVYDLCRMPRP